MAKHRKIRRRSSARGVDRTRKSPSLVLVGTVAGALSAVLVFDHSTNTAADSPQVDLAAATIGIGGRGDPNAANIPNKLHGEVVPFGATFPHYIPVNYPAGFDIDNSVAAGVPVLDQTVRDNSGQFLMVVGYSEGTLVAERVRRGLDPSQPDAPPLNPQNDTTKPGLLWVMIASPNVPNGGIFGRFPGLNIPFVVSSNGPAQPSPYDTTYVTNEYDAYADFPSYFNPLALVNTLVAIGYVHPDQYYDSVDYNPLTGTGTTPVLVKTVTNSAGGTDTYVFVPAEHLPLFAPVRQFAAVLHLTALTEPVLDGVEPLVRLVVDMGYTDRENLNPEKPITFSLITPPAKLLETVAGVPGALEQGANNFVTGVEAIPGSLPAPTNSPSINAKSPAQQPHSLANDPAPAGTPGPAQGQVPSASGTSTTQPPVSTQSDQGPTLNTVTGEGHKATPSNPGKTTLPTKNPLTQAADTVKGVFTPKKPAPTEPSSEHSTPSGSASQGATTSNAA